MESLKAECAGSGADLHQIGFLAGREKELCELTGTTFEEFSAANAEQWNQATRKR